MQFLAYTASKLKITIPKFIYFKIAVFAGQEMFHNYDMALFRFNQEKKIPYEAILKKACTTSFIITLSSFPVPLLHQPLFYEKEEQIIFKNANQEKKNGNDKLICEIIKSRDIDSFTLTKYICCYSTLKNVEQLFLEKIKYIDYGLERACKNSNLEVIDFLIQKGANLNKGLIMATSKNNLPLIKLLIEKYAFLFLPPSFSLREKEEALDFNAIFAKACFGDYNRIIKYMMNEYPVDLNEGLFSACRGQHPYLVEKLINKGAHKLNRGLKIAASKNDLVLTQLLISKGANNFTEAFGIACYFCSRAIIAYFLPKDVDYNYGLKKSCESGQTGVAEFLIHMGATDVNGCFYEACKSGYLDMVLLLIEAGATNFDTGLQGAAESFDFKDISAKLLELGAHPNYGLIGACITGDYYVIKYFIKKGAQNIFEMMDLHKNNLETIYSLDCILNKKKWKPLCKRLTVSEN